MKIFIAGGLGFVGTALTRYFLETGHQVVATGTQSRQNRIFSRPFFVYSGRYHTSGGLAGGAQGHGCRGESGRAFHISEMGCGLQNRFMTAGFCTRNLAEALAANSGKPTLISTSAVGFYGNRGDDLLTESDPPGDSFLARVCAGLGSRGVSCREERRAGGDHALWCGSGRRRRCSCQDDSDFPFICRGSGWIRTSVVLLDSPP